MYGPLAVWSNHLQAELFWVVFFFLSPYTQSFTMHNKAYWDLCLQCRVFRIWFRFQVLMFGSVSLKTDYALSLKAYQYGLCIAFKELLCSSFQALTWFQSHFTLGFGLIETGLCEIFLFFLPFLKPGLWRSFRSSWDTQPTSLKITISTKQ